MAILQTGAGGQEIKQFTGILTTTPISFSCWVNLNSITANGTMMAISSAQLGFTDMFELCVDTSAFSAQIGTGSGFGRGGPHASVALVAGVWYHCAAVFPGAGVATLYTNGNSKVSASGLGTPVAAHMNRTSIGTLSLATQIINSLNGSIAFTAIWNSVLSDLDIANLAGGIDPTTIQSSSLVSYNLLNSASPTTDQIFGTPWTVLGTLVQVADPILGAPIMSVQLATNILTTSATLNATIVTTGTSTTTVQGFSYGIDTSYGSVISNTGSFSAGPFALPVTGLLPDTVYHYQGFATNDTATSFTIDQPFLTDSIPGTVHTITDFIDPAYLTSVPWLTHSYWIQGTRAWFSAVPASDFIQGAGVVMNAPNPDLVFQMFSRNGIKTIRTELGWGGLAYADDSVTAASQPQWDAVLQACVKWGIRPLVLLNANSGVPCPMLNFNKTLAALAGISATQITLTDASGLIPNFSGFNSLTTFQACQVFVTSVNLGTGVVQLSNKFPVQRLSGTTIAMSTLKYKPWALPGSADYINTMNGWKLYVRNLAAFVQSYVGPGGFDMEIWNELTFDSQFLDINNYFLNKIAVPKSTVNSNENKVWTDIVQATCDVAAANPSLFTGVKIGDGFANIFPWPGSAQEPQQIKAVCKHPYPPLKTFPGADEKIPMINALLQNETVPLFVPSFTAYFPEYGLTHFQTESDFRDIAPINQSIGNIVHGRLARSDVTTTTNTQTFPTETITTTVTVSTSDPCPLWVTEHAFNPTAISITDVPTALLMKGKMHARCWVSLLGKGAQLVYIFGAKGSDLNIGVCQDNFITYVGSNSVYPDPSVEASYTSPTLSIIKNMMAQMEIGLDPGVTYATTRPLAIQSVSDDHNNIMWRGDGTPQHPNLYHRDVLMITAFQVNSGKFILPYYVMTLDVKNTYPLPPENFTVTFQGFNYSVATFSIYDPVLDTTSVPVSVSGSGTTSILTLAATDYPIFLIVTEPIGTITPGTVPIMQTVSSTVLSSTTVNLFGNVLDTGGLSMTLQGFNYGTTTAYGSTATQAGIGLGDFSQTLTGLLPGTLYHYTAIGSNSAGLAHGLDKTFITGALMEEGFFFGQTLSYGSRQSLTGSLNAGPYNLLITNLNPGSLYHFRAFGTNLQGTSTGQDLTFTVPALPPPDFIPIPAVTTLPVLSFDSTSAILQGSVLDFETTTEHGAVGFNWGLGVGYGFTAEVSNSAPVGTFQLSIIDLIPGAIYHFQAYADNGIAVGTGLDSVFTTIRIETPSELWEPMNTVVERALLVTEPDLITDEKIIASGGPEPAFLHHGARPSDWIPEDLLRMYNQMYDQSESIPKTTGLKYSDSLESGGSSPYDGKT